MATSECVEEITQHKLHLEAKIKQVELLDLPVEVLQYILSFLYYCDIKTTSMVCHTLHSVTLKPIWRSAAIYINKLIGRRPPKQVLLYMYNNTSALRILDNFTTHSTFSKKLTQEHAILGNRILIKMCSEDNLTSLSLKSKGVTDDLMKLISKYINLRKLDLENCREITDEGFATLCTLENLRDLNVSRTHISNKGLITFASLKSLQKLSIESCPNITGIDHDTLPDSLRNLQTSGCYFEDSGMRSVRYLKGLKYITFDSFDLTDSGISYLHSLHNLLGVELYNTQITNKGLKAFGKMKYLEDLYLTNSTNVTNIHHLKHLHTLKFLDLTNTHVSNYGLMHVGSLHNLSYLALSTCKDFSNIALLSSLKKLKSLDLADTGITDVAMEHIIHLENLVDLLLTSCDLTDAGIAPLAHLKKLRNLEASHIKALTNKSLTHIGKTCSLEILHLRGMEKLSDVTPLTQLEKLWWLDLSLTSVNSEGLKHIGDIKNLKNLILVKCNLNDDCLARLKPLHKLKLLILFDNSKITDTGIKHLNALTSLERLNLNGCNLDDYHLKHLHIKTLQNLKLSENHLFTDESLEYICKMSKLYYLQLVGCSITDKALKIISKHNNIRYIDIDGCMKVTDRGCDLVRDKLVTNHSVDNSDDQYESWWDEDQDADDLSIEEQVDEEELVQENGDLLNWFM